MGIDSHLSTCVGTQSPKYLEMAQGHISLSAPSPPTDQRFEGWPSEGFDSRLRALRLRAHYWSEVRRLAPRKGSTAASGHSGSAPTTDQGFVGWPPKGSTAASEHTERGMTL